MAISPIPIETRHQMAGASVGSSVSLPARIGPARAWNGTKRQAPWSSGSRKTVATQAGKPAPIQGPGPSAPSRSSAGMSQAMCLSPETVQSGAPHSVVPARSGPAQSKGQICSSITAAEAPQARWTPARARSRAARGATPIAKALMKTGWKAMCSQASSVVAWLAGLAHRSTVAWPATCSASISVNRARQAEIATGSRRPMVVAVAAVPGPSMATVPPIEKHVAVRSPWPLQRAVWQAGREGHPPRRPRDDSGRGGCPRARRSPPRAGRRVS